MAWSALITEEAEEQKSRRTEEQKGAVFTFDTNDNPFGRCVKRVKDGWDAKYSYYDGERELLECGPGGGAAFKNTYGKGIDEILKRLDTTNNWPLYFQQDANTNVTELTWSDGGVVEIFQYDAFGALNKTASGWGNPFLFTGRRYQSTFGIYEYRARAYSPRLGRFTGEDPTLYDAGDYNLFRYCHNDPLDLTDPMGTQEQYHGTLAHSPDRLWEMTKWFDSSNLQHGNFPGFAGAQGFTMGQIEAASRYSGKVDFVKSYTERKSPEEIAASKDPGVSPGTKSYTLPVVAKTQVTEDPRTGSVNVTIPVYAKKVLPNNTDKYDQKERQQVVSVIEAASRAQVRVNALSSQHFQDAHTFQHAVERAAYKELWIQNRQRIFFTDATPW
jgi:RHS repeat-associated protein